MNLSKNNKLALSGGALLATGGVVAALLLTSGGSDSVNPGTPTANGSPVSESADPSIDPADLSGIPADLPVVEIPDGLEPSIPLETPEVTVPKDTTPDLPVARSPQFGAPGVSSPTPTTKKPADKIVAEAPVVRPPNAALPGEAPPVIAPPALELPANPPLIQDNNIYLADACLGVSVEFVNNLIERDDVKASSPFNGSCDYKTPEADNDADGTGSTFSVNYLPKDATYLDLYKAEITPVTLSNGDVYYWLNTGSTTTALVERGDYAVLVSYTSFDESKTASERKATLTKFAKEALSWINELKPAPLPLFKSHPELGTQPSTGDGTEFEAPVSGTPGPADGIGDPDASPSPSTPPPAGTPAPTDNPSNPVVLTPPEDPEPLYDPSDPVSVIKNFWDKIFG